MISSNLFHFDNFINMTSVMIYFSFLSHHADFLPLLIMIQLTVGITILISGFKESRYEILDMRGRIGN